MNSLLLLLFGSVIADRHYGEYSSFLSVGPKGNDNGKYRIRLTDRLYNELSQSIANAKIKGEENIEITKELYYER